MKKILFSPSEEDKTGQSYLTGENMFQVQLPIQPSWLHSVLLQQLDFYKIILR